MAKFELRPIRIEGNVAYIPLTRGYEAVIDAADVPLVEKFSWRSAPMWRTVYALRSRRQGAKVITSNLHRDLLNASVGMEVDHIDGDGLNNRRSNLRLATSSENKWNRGRLSTNTSGYKGVSWHNGAKRWQASIRVAYRLIYLGAFQTPEDAHAAYCEAAARLHGDFAKSS
jgi:hypothetical protein